MKTKGKNHNTAQNKGKSADMHFFYKEIAKKGYDFYRLMILAIMSI